MSTNYIKTAIKMVGRTRLAKELNLSTTAILRWEKNGKLPRTEYTGETNYSDVIISLSKNKIKRRHLLPKLS